MSPVRMHPTTSLLPSGVQHRFTCSQIALGVFLGSDYHDGVKGIGVQKATRLVAQLGEAQVLETILRNGVQAVLSEGRPKTSKAKAGRATEGAEAPGANAVALVQSAGSTLQVLPLRTGWPSGTTSCQMQQLFQG